MEACLQLIRPLLSSKRNLAVIEVSSRWRREIKLKGGDDLQDLLGKVLALLLSLETKCAEKEKA
ncbi:hypothetical protein YC2023_079727 [Brassica napus]